MATIPQPTRRRKPDRNAPGDRVQVVTNDWTLSVPDSALTLAGFRAWATRDDFPEKVRVFFYRGEVWVDMSNEELETHNKVKGEITRAILTLNNELDLGECYVDGILVTNEDADLSNNPDALLVLHETIAANRVQFVQRTNAPTQFIEMTGTPDWVLEVVSRGSVRKDTQQLREAYHKAGIPEYWLIDARGDEIQFQILYHRKNAYVTAPNQEGWQRSRIFKRSFRLDRQLTRSNKYRYTLHVRDD